MTQRRDLGYDGRVTQQAHTLLPYWLRRSQGAQQLCAAIDRGDVIMMPSRAVMGSTGGALYCVAREVGATVVVLEDLAAITTRERIEA